MPIRRLLLIGMGLSDRPIPIGAGDPSFVTVQAAGAIAEVDAFLVIDKGEAKGDLVGVRRQVLDRFAGGLVLHPAAYLVELGVGQLHQMERIGHLAGIGEDRVEHRPIWARQVERRPLDPIEPRLRAGVEPGARPGAVTPGDDVEQPAGADVDDRRRPALASPWPDPHEQRLIESNGSGFADPIGVVDEGFERGRYSMRTICLEGDRAAYYSISGSLRTDSLEVIE